ncbi:hypothetical protein FBU30_003963 [Linnemannia zychae]|nr:hypothetical protein FBU30_003963 [Linnemannia zychae]
MAALLRTSPNLGFRIKNIALPRAIPPSGTRFASSIDAPIRTAYRTSSRTAPPKEFVSAFVGGSRIDDKTPQTSSKPTTTGTTSKTSAFIRKRSSPSKTPGLTTQRAQGLPAGHLLVTKDFVKIVQNHWSPQKVLDHVMEARNQRDWEFMLGRIMNEYLKHDQVHSIEPLINEMEKRGLTVQSETYTILLRGLATHAFSPAHTTAAKSLYSRLKSQYNHPPTIEQANSMMWLYRRLGDVEGMEQIYSDMAKKGPDAPTVVTYGILIKTYGRMGGDRAFERAWRIWVDYLNTIKIRREEGEGVDTGMLSTIMLACKVSTNPDYSRRAYRLFESYYGMESGPPTLLAGASVPSIGAAAGSSEGYGHVRQQGGPRKILSAELEQSASNKGLTLSGSEGAKGSDDPWPEMLEVVLGICTQLGDYSRGIRYMEFIREKFPEFQPSNRNLTTYMRLQTLAKDYQGASKTWSEFEKLGEFTRASWKQGLQTAIEANDWDWILRMYNADKTKCLNQNSNPATASAEGYTPDAWTLASTLGMAVRTHHFSEGLEILQESNWQKVIQNHEFPRANLDIARAAVKIYAKFKYNSSDDASHSSDSAEEWRTHEHFHEEIERDRDPIKVEEVGELKKTDEVKRPSEVKETKQAVERGVSKSAEHLDLVEKWKQAMNIRTKLEAELVDYHIDGAKGYQKRVIAHGGRGEERFIVGEYGSIRRQQ